MERDNTQMFYLRSVWQIKGLARVFEPSDLTKGKSLKGVRRR